MPISGMFRITRKMLPIQKLTISPQNSSGWLVSTCGPGLDALDRQRGQHQRHDRVARNAERQRRDEGGAHTGVVAGLRAGDALDRALAELLRDAWRCASRSRRRGRSPCRRWCPGSAPKKAPSPEPRSIGPMERRQSSRVGIWSRRLNFCVADRDRAPCRRS